MTKIVANQNGVVVNRVETARENRATTSNYDYTRRSDYLDRDTLDLSNVKIEKQEKNSIVKNTCDAIGNGVKSFANAFAKAAGEATVNITLNKLIK